MEFPTSELWNYSSQVWALPGVEDTCLKLQNEYELNVNLLLFCCWAGDQKICLSEANMQTLIDAAASWETVIKPLRESRMMMKQNLIAMPVEAAEQTLKNISDMELNAERMEQLSLEKALTLNGLASCDGTAVEFSLNNLNLYLKKVAPEEIGELNSYISQLLSNLYDDEEAVQMAMMTAMTDA